MNLIRFVGDNMEDKKRYQEIITALSKENVHLRKKLNTSVAISKELAKVIYEVACYESVDNDYVDMTVYNWKAPMDNEEKGTEMAVEWARNKVKQKEQETRDRGFVISPRIYRRMSRLYLN